MYFVSIQLKEKTVWRCQLWRLSAKSNYQNNDQHRKIEKFWKFLCKRRNAHNHVKAKDMLIQFHFSKWHILNHTCSFDKTSWLFHFNSLCHQPLGNLNNLEQLPLVNIFKTWQPFYLISYRNCTPQRVACRRNWELLLCFLMKGVTGAICLRYLAMKKKCLKLSMSKSIPCGTNVLHVIFLANKIFKPFIFIGHCKPKEVPKCSKKT